MPASLSTTLAMKKERGKEPIDLTIVTQRGLFAPCLQAAPATPVLLSMRPAYVWEFTATSLSLFKQVPRGFFKKECHLPFPPLS